MYLIRFSIGTVLSRITNIQFSWLKSVPNDFSLVVDRQNHGCNFITKKKIFLVHQKRKLATIEINKYLF